MKLEIPYGKDFVQLEVPDGHPVEVYRPNEKPIISDPDTLISRALKNPIGRGRLGDIVQPGDTVSIIVSDITRPVPTAVMLNPLLQALLAAGITKKGIRIIFGLGIHRPQSEAEKINIVGPDIFRDYLCMDHDVNNCRYLGTTSRGTPVEIFEPVVESDVVICTGSIEFHYFAGYTGGYKSILPAVSSRRSIEINHALMLEKGTACGNPICPVRADLEEAGKILGVDFILNVILDSHKNVVGAVAGHPVEAHRAGVEMVDRLFRLEAEAADIAVVSPGGWPKDINLFQSHKALEHVKSAVRPGGAVILLARCQEGLGNEIYEQWVHTTSGPLEAVEKLGQGFVQGGHKAALIGKMALDLELYLVSELPDEISRKAYFTPAPGVQEAFDAAAAKYGRGAKVIVVPYGGSTLVAGNDMVKESRRNEVAE